MKPNLSPVASRIDAFTRITRCRESFQIAFSRGTFGQLPCGFGLAHSLCKLLWVLFPRLRLHALSSKQEGDQRDIFVR